MASLSEIQEQQPTVEGEAVAGPVILPTYGPSTGDQLAVLIRNAKMFPRDLPAVRQAITAMATLDEESAASCFYSLPRGGKPIEGPSVRLAEILFSQWGHLWADARIVAEERSHIVAEAGVIDLQTGSGIRWQSRRRITDKRGRRYGDDMIGVTSNAACAVAFREATFKVVPRAFWLPAYKAARRASIGDVKTLAAQRADALAYFQKMGVTEKQILGALALKGLEDIGPDELITLKGLATAIRDKEINIDEAFGPKRAKAAAAVEGPVDLGDLGGKKGTLL